MVEEMVLTIKYSIIILIFTPTLLFGQSKYCNTYFKPPKLVSCYLAVNKTIHDTSIIILPKGCNDFHFDSIPNGYCKILSSDSIALIEIDEIKNGKRNGTRISFYSNGKIEEKAEYKDGKLNGNYIYFFETGKTKEGTYKIDKKGYEIFTGTATEYWDNGNIAKQVPYKNGTYKIFQDEKYWDKEGKVIDSEQFSKLWFDCK